MDIRFSANIAIVSLEHRNLENTFPTINPLYDGGGGTVHLPPVGLVLFVPVRKWVSAAGLAKALAVAGERTKQSQQQIASHSSVLGDRKCKACNACLEAGTVFHVL